MLGRVTSASLRWVTAHPTPRLQGLLRTSARSFVGTPSLQAPRPYLLADIGEGITECQVIRWDVKEGDVVQQFDPICEVQSDKASVEITSRFNGEIKKLHYEEGEMAKVGAALLDMDVSGEDDADDRAAALAAESKGVLQDMQVMDTKAEPEDIVPAPEDEIMLSSSPSSITTPVPDITQLKPPERHESPSSLNNVSTLATPAVRHLLKQNNIEITDVKGTGKDGRVLKGDITRYLEAGTGRSAQPKSTEAPPPPEQAVVDSGDHRKALTPIQSHMFKTMTASLSIPHFLYTHTVDLTPLMELVKGYRHDASLSSELEDGAGATVRLTVSPFVLKAISQAFRKFPGLNSLLDVGNSSDDQPALIMKSSHDFGIAVDTPNGLLVPVIRGVQNRSILNIASEASRLANLAKTSKISPDDMKGASFTVSNIGSIGGSVVGPVIVPPMVTILAIGKAEEVVALEIDKDGIERLVKKNKVVLSWSADHRVLDGAMVARCGQEVAKLIERPELMGLLLK